MGFANYIILWLSDFRLIFIPVTNLLEIEKKSVPIAVTTIQRLQGYHAVLERAQAHR